jgi:hypothetical protein
MRHATTPKAKPRKHVALSLALAAVGAAAAWAASSAPARSDAHDIVDEALCKVPDFETYKQLIELLEPSSEAYAHDFATSFSRKKGCDTLAGRARLAMSPKYRYKIGDSYEERKSKCAKRSCWLPKYDTEIRALLRDDSPFLGNEVPVDIAQVCPGYATMGTSDLARRRERRRAFWIYLVQAVAGPESGYCADNVLDEDTRYDKDKHPVKRGKNGFDELPPIYSQGLLQVTPGICNSKGLNKLPSFNRIRDELDCESGNCEKKWVHNVPSLYDTSKNFECALGNLSGVMFATDEPQESRSRFEHGLFSRKNQWSTLHQDPKDAAVVEDCLRQIPGLKYGKSGPDLDAIPEKYRDDVVACRARAARNRVIGEFWENYGVQVDEGGRKHKSSAPHARDLCNLKNRFDFCGELHCKLDFHGKDGFLGKAGKKFGKIGGRGERRHIGGDTPHLQRYRSHD